MLLTAYYKTIWLSRRMVNDRPIFKSGIVAAHGCPVSTEEPRIVSVGTFVMDDKVPIIVQSTLSRFPPVLDDCPKQRGKSVCTGN